MEQKDLKYGDISNEVGEVQQMLIDLGYDLGHGGADNHFFQATKKAVEEFQTKNFVTGEVDEVTYNLIKSRHESRKKNELIVTKYPLRHNEYGHHVIEKTAICLHLTAGGGSGKNTVDWWNMQTGIVGTPYVVSREHDHSYNPTSDGEIIQCFPEDEWAYHLGVGNKYLEQKVVGIEICNYGPLFMKCGRYFVQAYPNIEIQPHEVEILNEPFAGFKLWHRITDAQIESVVNICKYLASKYPRIRLDYDYPEGWTSYDIKNHNLPRPGVYAHTNFVPFSRRVDLPGFKRLSNALREAGK